MARYLLNTRASRITVVDNILLLPAEVRKDERLGNVVQPSRTLISELGKPSPYERIMADPNTQKLFEGKVLEWSTDKADEPEKVLGTKGASPYPRVDQAGEMVKTTTRDPLIVSRPGEQVTPPDAPQQTSDRVSTDESVDAVPVPVTPHTEPHTRKHGRG